MFSDMFPCLLQSNLQSSYYQALPDIVFACEKYDDSRVRVFPETPDDLVKPPQLGLPGNLHRLGDAHTP